MQSTRHMVIFLSFLILFYAGFGAVIYWQLTHFADIINDINTHPMTVTRSTLTASRNVVRISRNIKDMLLVSHPEHIRERLLEIEQDERDTDQNIALVLERIYAEDGRVLVRSAMELIHEQKLLRKRITDAIFSGDTKTGEKLARVEGIPLMKELEEIMAKIANYAETQSLTFHIQSVSDLKRAKVVLLSAGLIVLILSLTFAVIAWRSLRTTLRKSGIRLRDSSALSSINLATVFETPSPGAIAEALNAFFQKVRTIIGELKDNHEELNRKIANLMVYTDVLPEAIDEVSTKTADIINRIVALLDVHQQNNKAYRVSFDLLTEIKGDLRLLSQFASTKDLMIEKIDTEKDPAGIKENLESIRAHSKSMQDNFDRAMRSLDSAIEIFTSLLLRLNDLRLASFANQDTLSKAEQLKAKTQISKELASDIKLLAKQMGEKINTFKL